MSRRVHREARPESPLATPPTAPPIPKPSFGAPPPRALVGRMRLQMPPLQRSISGIRSSRARPQTGRPASASVHSPRPHHRPHHRAQRPLRRPRQRKPREPRGGHPPKPHPLLAPAVIWTTGAPTPGELQGVSWELLWAVLCAVLWAVQWALYHLPVSSPQPLSAPTSVRLPNVTEAHNGFRRTCEESGQKIRGRPPSTWTLAADQHRRASPPPHPVHPRVRVRAQVRVHVGVHVGVRVRHRSPLATRGFDLSAL